MPTTVFINGAFTTPDEAKLSALDAGLQHGVGLFETMLGGVADDGEARVVALGDHLARLDRSARALRLSDSLRTGPLGDAVIETVKRSGLARARVRLTVTGGGAMTLAAARGGSGGGAPAPHRAEATVLIVAQPATEYPPAMFERGVRVALADARANPLMPDEGHKTLNYWWRLRELQAAAAKGAAEALVFQVTNHLCGGCVSNCLIVRDGRILTPIAKGEEDEVAGRSGAEERGTEGSVASGAVMPSPVLPGVTRAAVIDLAEETGFGVVRRMLSVDDVLGADEVMLTNSSWGVLPVAAVEGEVIGQGKPGEVTRRLRAALEARTNSDLSPV